MSAPPFYPLIAVLVGLTPSLALLLTWLVLLPFVGARAGLDLVGADAGLSVRVPPMGIMVMVFALCSARAAQLHARGNRTNTASRGSARSFSLLWLICLVGCTGLILAGAGSVWIEAGGEADLPEPLQRTLVIGGLLAWAIPITGLTVITGVWCAGVIVRVMQWDGFVRALGVVFLVLPSGLVAVVLMAPEELERSENIAAIAGVASATGSLLKLTESSSSLADTGGLSWGFDGPDDSDGPSPPLLEERYDVVECLEALASPPMPGTSSIRISARCEPAERRSPIEDVWCDLERTQDRWVLEHALADSIVKTCETRPRRNGNLTGYLRTTTLHELRQERRRSNSRGKNAPIYYEGRPVYSDPDASIDRERCIEAMTLAIEKLPERDRKLFRDKYQHEKSWREIARERGESEAAVRKRGERIRDSLRESLGRVCR